MSDPNHEEQSPSAAPPPQIPCVLVIDDDVPTAESVAQFLKLHHIPVTVATNGLEGLEFARTNYPRVIFCDILMPGMSGYQVAASLRTERTYHPYLVAWSALAAEDYEPQALAAGFEYYMVKPVDPFMVLQIVKTKMSESANGRVPGRNL